MTNDETRALWALADHGGTLFIGDANTSNDYAVARKTAERLAAAGLIEIRNGRTISGHDIAALTAKGRAVTTGNTD